MVQSVIDNIGNELKERHQKISDMNKSRNQMLMFSKVAWGSLLLWLKNFADTGVARY